MKKGTNKSQKITLIIDSSNLMQVSYEHTNQFVKDGEHPYESEKKELEKIPNNEWIRSKRRKEAIKADTEKEIAHGKEQFVDHIAPIRSRYEDAKGKVAKIAEELRGYINEFNELNKGLQNVISGSCRDKASLGLTDSILDYVCVGTLLTLLFVLIDYSRMYEYVDLVCLESALGVLCTAGAAAIALDVPPAIAARKTKEYMAGMCSKKTMLWWNLIALVAFLVIYIVYAMGVYSNRALMFDTTMISGLEEATSDESLKYNALFTAMIPFATSISSYLINLVTYNPVKELAKKYKRNIKETYRKALECIIALRETNPYDDAKHLLAIENARFKSFIDSCSAQLKVRLSASLQALEDLLSPVEALQVAERAENIISDAVSTIDYSCHDEALTEFEEMLERDKKELEDLLTSLPSINKEMELA